MEEPLIVDESLTIPGHELWFVASRSGGPGGQHVNKVNSRVSLHWSVRSSGALEPHLKARILRRLNNRITKDGVLIVHVDTERSQHRNREIARERLAEMLKEALAKKKKRVPTKMSQGAKRRRIEEKKRRGAVKQMRRVPADY